MTVDVNPLTLLLLERLRDDMRAKVLAAKPQISVPSAPTYRFTRLASQLTMLMAGLACLLLSLAELHAG